VSVLGRAWQSRPTCEARCTSPAGYPALIGGSRTRLLHRWSGHIKEARLPRSCDGGDVFFLRAEYKEIPQEIRSLNETEKMRSAIPERLKDVVWLIEVEPLGTGPSPAADSEDDQDDGCRKKGKANMDVRGWGG